MAAVLGCCLIAQASAANGQEERQPLPLGAADLMESRQVQEIEPGVRIVSILRQPRKEAGRWTLLAGAARNQLELASAETCVAAAGVVPKRRVFQFGGDSRSYTEVSGGEFPTEAGAHDWLDHHLPPKDCHLAVISEGNEPSSGHETWRVFVVQVDPSTFHGKIDSALAHDTVVRSERTSSLAARKGARVALNGGFFTMRDVESIEGEPAGIAVQRGVMTSEPTALRPFLVFNSENPALMRVVKPTRRLNIALESSDGSELQIDGIDRPAGIVRNCGEEGALPTASAWHDHTCTNPNEIIAITPEAGFVPYSTSGFWALLDGKGQLKAVQPPVLVPEPGAVLLLATGTKVPALRDRVEGRLSAKLKIDLLAFMGLPAGTTADGIFAVNGGPTLLDAGQGVHDELNEGFPFYEVADPVDALEMHRWVNLRAPRTAAGITADGKLVFIVVDGRRFAGGKATYLSAGATIEEMRQLMKYFGAWQAINLDGGGSSTVVVDGRVLNSPSDAAGERPIGDAILIR
jgi:hypothetical protein